MKKNVLKAMSVGLSAITIASTLSVPVYADEPVPEPISAPTEPAENQGQQVGDVTVKEKSPLKVTEDVDDIAKELPRGENLPKAVEGEITEENPANVTNHLNDAASELHDLSGKDSIDEVEDKFDEGEIDLKKDEQKGTTDILNTLEGTASVEIANVALEFYDDAAQRLEGTASKAASDADAAASNLSGASLTQANIDSARELVNQANQTASDADKAVKFAGAVLLLRQNNLNTLLKENGLSEVSEEDLETLYAALTTDDVESDLLDTLDGNAKEAIVAAKKALDKATDDAAAALQAQNNAKSVVASLAEDLLTQIALKQEAVGKESATEADVAALAKFVYEYYLQKTLGDSYLKGSLSLTGKTSVDGVNYYEVSYKKTGDEVPSLQGYAGYKKSEDGKNVIIYAYTKTEENTNEVINPATPESWKTADGTKEYVMPETPAGDYSDPVWVDSEDHDKGFYQIGDINKLLNDKIKPKDIEVKPVGPDWKKVEGT
ncbi:MAG: hypothetical protein IKP29_04995, partial [Pseudobutyrivibrio sp.]|nr:hypothetical protein [Pseudobutyrivibrio sp.]